MEKKIITIPQDFSERISNTVNQAPLVVTQLKDLQ